MHTILVADDSVTIQRAVEIVFDKEPFTVVKTGSGHEALNRARELRPHLVLADHTMADQSGYDLAAALKADPATSDIPVVLLSAAANPYDEGRGSAAGVVAHVQKPFDCATLLDRVRGILGVAATAPGTSLPPSAPVSTAAAANMPRPPTLGGFTVPRPPISPPGFAPRAPTTPPQPAPVAPVVARTATPAPASDPFGLGSALSQPAPSTPPTAVAVSPLSSPSSLSTTQQPSGWTSMSPGQSLSSALSSAPTPMPHQAVIASAPTPGPRVGLAELGEADLGFHAPVPTTPAPVVPSSFSSTPTPGPMAAVPAHDAAKATAKLGLEAIAAAAAADAVVDRAAPAIAAATGEAPSREALSLEAKAIIERIVWEVVPELAETIIREELARLLKARGA